MTTPPDTFAESFIPPHAVTMWSDDRDIFVALPVKNGPPYISRFPLNSQGLSKALHVLRNARKKHAPTIPTYNLETREQAVIQRKTPKMNQDQRQSVRDILKKRGLIG